MNRTLLKNCTIQNVTFIQQKDGWVNDGELNELFFTDNLHLVEAGNTKLAESFVKTIHSLKDSPHVTNIKNLPLFKNIVHRENFMFLEEDFPSLTIPKSNQYTSPATINKNKTLLSSMLLSIQQNKK